MLILKLKYFVHYYKSKILKKKCKKNYKDQKIKFEYDIKEKNFSNKWFLNNFDIFNFFLPKEKNSKFDYLEVGCFEGLSSFFVLSGGEGFRPAWPICFGTGSGGSVRDVAARRQFSVCLSRGRTTSCSPPSRHEGSTRPVILGLCSNMV